MAALSAVLVVPGVVLALAPGLWPRPTVVVRIWGEAVEILDGPRRKRLAVAGGAVHVVWDALGFPQVDLVGRDGETVTLLVPTGVVDDLVAALVQATRAPPAAPREPIPDALSGLREGASEVGAATASRTARRTES
jgi:hypothetical protein